MASFFFGGSSRPDTSWHFVGAASAFPNITTSEASRLAKQYPCDTGGRKPGCSVFSITDGKDSEVVPVELDDQVITTDELKQQVMVFQYNGKFHAVDHKCPHASFPLSLATPFDIEDFGVVLSAGIMCPKHDWSFDMFTGQSDRNMYKLRIWEVQLREPGKEKSVGVDGSDQEVWIRKKPKLG